MYKYEQLMSESPIPVVDGATLPERFKGMYLETGQACRVFVAKRVKCRREKVCIIAEEIGHHLKTAGDISDLTILKNRQQEQRALSWAYERLVPFSSIVEAHRIRISNRFEFAGFLDVTEDFLDCAVRYYLGKYGLCIPYDNKYIIHFAPLGVTEMFE